uniref:Putative secreted protein n=1 Tax=Anopheles marajoara TaxID=58244 RepID=A0A2M4CE15_9DIPT
MHREAFSPPLSLCSLSLSLSLSVALPPPTVAFGADAPLSYECTSQGLREGGGWNWTEGCHEGARMLFLSLC